ncbi:hypothetical protein [Streptomyces sp. GC420]|uniref:hypothetical protein n=1 Tax=Streptomyces sp. GC420 TaxID=2697568 RepID=UPI0014150605|nr:hypothetical protein [Streptomyces sp. GC420]NBM18061.1 hypothetical protein [Streptomyces sp. GC420]
MAWMYAEYIAEELLRAGDLVPAPSLEFRSGRQTLALTVFLSDTADELSGIRVVSQLDEWLALTSHGHPWQDWVRERLAELGDRETARGRQDPDLALARAAWDWLERTELFAADLEGLVPCPQPVLPLDVDEDRKAWTPAWQLGLPLGNLALQLF